MDFSYVAQMLADEETRARELKARAQAVLPRLLAHHKCKLEVKHIVRQILTSTWDISVCNASGHNIWSITFVRDVMPDASDFAHMFIKDYMDGYVIMPDKMSAIKASSIEELDLKLAVLGF